MSTLLSPWFESQRLYRLTQDTGVEVYDTGAIVKGLQWDTEWADTLPTFRWGNGSCSKTLYVRYRENFLCLNVISSADNIGKSEELLRVFILWLAEEQKLNIPFVLVTAVDDFCKFKSYRLFKDGSVKEIAELRETYALRMYPVNPVIRESALRVDFSTDNKKYVSTLYFKDINILRMPGVLLTYIRYFLAVHRLTSYIGRITVTKKFGASTSKVAMVQLRYLEKGSTILEFVGKCAW